jgi:predicted kinase
MELGELGARALYFRIANIGQAGTLRSEKQEDLAALTEHYEDLPLTIVFESPSRWQDARNLKKLLEEEA